MTENKYLSELLARAKTNLKTIVLPEGEDERILVAAHQVALQKSAKLIILGNVEEIRAFFAQKSWDMEGIELIHPESSLNMEKYANLFYELRKDKGVTLEDAKKQLQNYNYFATMMVKAGDADGMVSGANHSTADTVRPALQIIKSSKPGRSVSSAMVMVINGKPFVLADCGLMINPNAKELADIAVDTAITAKMVGIEPRVAMLSYSTKGSGKGESVDKVVEATKIALDEIKSSEYAQYGIVLDGEMQADAALDDVVAAKKAPNSSVAGSANVLVFPNLDAGNLGYKLLQRMCGADAYGPLLQGLNAPINDLSRGSMVEDIIGMIAITCLQAVK